MLPGIALEMDWSPQERNWLGWIRDIFFETGFRRGRLSWPVFQRVALAPMRNGFDVSMTA